MKNALLFVGGLVAGLGVCYVALMWYLSKVFRQ